MPYTVEQMRRTHDELELVVICLDALLGESEDSQGHAALDAAAKAHFEAALNLARREAARLSRRLYDDTDDPNVPDIPRLLTDQDDAPG